MDGGLCISSITLAELEYGMKHSSAPARNEHALLRFLSPLSILPYPDESRADYYARVRANPIAADVKYAELQVLA